MSSAVSSVEIRPDRQTPKTLGMLNVAYGLGLIVVTLCSNFYAMLVPLLSVALDQQAARAEAQYQARKVEYDDLRKQEAGAATDEERKPLTEKREAMEKDQEAAVRMPRMKSLAQLRTPAILGHLVFDLASGIVLNLAMFASGIGLWKLRRWGRYLWLGTAWLKLLRLIVLATSAALIVAPTVGRAISALEAENLGGATSTDAGPAVAWFVTLYYLALAVFGSIYPLLSVWLLGLPSIRAAFLVPKGDRR